MANKNVTSLIPNYFVFSSKETVQKFCKQLGATYFPGYNNFTAYIPESVKVPVSWLSLNEHCTVEILN